MHAVGSRKGTDIANGVADTGDFDLDHLRTEPCEGCAEKRPREKDCHRQDTDIVQGLHGKILSRSSKGRKASPQ
jgi:hypothetical protein